MPLASVDGIDIAYTESGAGEPLVFIHGFPLNRESWAPQVQALSDRARCIAIDLRGHGQSQAPLWLASVDTYADEVAGLLDRLSVEKAVICGLSMGGYVTFALWRRHRERIRALILADTRAQPDTPEGRRGRFDMAQIAWQQGAGPIADALLPRFFAPASFAEKPNLVRSIRAMIESTPLSGILGDLMAMAERPDSRPLLPEIDVPTLVVVGEHDVLTPPDDSRFIASSIPGARLLTIEGAGHLSNLEEPAVFNAAVAAFLQGLPR